MRTSARFKLVEPASWIEEDDRWDPHSCKRCALQVIQFMEQHGPNNPGMYTYHDCATIQITADPKKPIDAAWPKERQGT